MRPSQPGRPGARRVAPSCSTPFGARRGSPIRGPAACSPACVPHPSKLRGLRCSKTCWRRPTARPTGCRGWPSGTSTATTCWPTAWQKRRRQRLGAGQLGCASGRGARPSASSRQTAATSKVRRCTTRSASRTCSPSCRCSPPRRRGHGSRCWHVQRNGSRGCAIPTAACPRLATPTPMPCKGCRWRLPPSRTAVTGQGRRRWPQRSSRRGWPATAWTGSWSTRRRWSGPTNRDTPTTTPSASRSASAGSAGWLTRGWAAMTATPTAPYAAAARATVRWTWRAGRPWSCGGLSVSVPAALSATSSVVADALSHGEGMGRLIVAPQVVIGDGELRLGDARCAVAASEVLAIGRGLRFRHRRRVEDGDELRYAVGTTPVWVALGGTGLPALPPWQQLWQQLGSSPAV